MSRTVHVCLFLWRVNHPGTSRYSTCFCVEDQELLVVEAALSAGAYPNIRVMRIPALSWAAERGDTELMRLLLASGADIQANGNFGSGALARAAAGEKVNAVKLLLET